MVKEKIVEIKIQPINTSTIKLKIEGVTPLLMDRFTEEAEQQILAKQTGIAKSNKKSVRNTATEVINAIHYIDAKKGKIGFPSDGFKKGMIESTSFIGDKFFSKKLVSGAVKIMNTKSGLVEIKFEKQDVLQHNINGNIKFTPQFHTWKCELTILYDVNNINPQDIISLLNYAGFYYGIGAWRPKCKGGGSGDFGMYKVVLKK